MDISEIRSIEDLINFYGEADADRNGRLEPAELDGTLSAVEDLDANDDGSFSPFEIMQAVNNMGNGRINLIFSAEIISAYRSLNDSGRTFDNVRLEHSAVLQGKWFMEGFTVDFHDNGQIRSGTLFVDQQIGDLFFEGNTRVSFYDNGNVRSGCLARDTRLGALNILFSAGRKRLIWQINNIHFYRSGAVESGTLAEPLVVGGITLIEGTHIDLEEDGRVSGAALKDERIIHSEAFGPGTDVEFGEDGQISMRLRESSSIRRVFFHVGTEVTFDREGKLLSARLSETTEIRGMMFQGSALWNMFGLFPSPVEFYDSGMVRSGTLAESITDEHGRTYRSGEEIVFHRNGRVQKGCLESDFTDESGQVYEAGTCIETDMYGEIIGADTSWF